MITNDSGKNYMLVWKDLNDKERREILRKEDLDGIVYLPLATIEKLVNRYCRSGNREIVTK